MDSVPLSLLIYRAKSTMDQVLDADAQAQSSVKTKQNKTLLLIYVCFLKYGEQNGRYSLESSYNERFLPLMYLRQ